MHTRSSLLLKRGTSNQPERATEQASTAEGSCAQTFRSQKSRESQRGPEVRRTPLLVTAAPTTASADAEGCPLVSDAWLHHSLPQPMRRERKHQQHSSVVVPRPLPPVWCLFVSAGRHCQPRRARERAFLQSELQSIAVPGAIPSVSPVCPLPPSPLPSPERRDAPAS